VVHEERAILPMEKISIVYDPKQREKTKKRRKKREKKESRKKEIWKEGKSINSN
jgi:hypothetical protein